MSAEVHNFHRSLVERYNAEYCSPLEALLVCMIDAHWRHSSPVTSEFEKRYGLLTNIDRKTS